jgi:hypothetical protein
MTTTKRQVALLRYGQRQLGWSDDTWRVTLAELGGVASTTELDQAGFDLIMGFLDYSGWRPAQAKGPDYGNRPGFASFAQLELIRTLWREWTRGEGTAEGLNTWLNRTFKVTHPRFLTAQAAQKAIGALRRMKARAPRAA